MAAHLESKSGRATEMFRALTHRNFRLFWIGAFLSNSGTWMQTVAQGWLVLKLTDSPFWLGVDSFMATAPGLLLTLLGGVFADLLDRKRLLIASQVGAGLSALALAVLVATGVVQVWMILVLSFVTGCCFSIAGPSYQAITVDLVGREDLANAIALNSTQFQFSRVVGPLLAGVAMSLLGIAGCFFVNALSFVAIIWALLNVHFDEKPDVVGSATKAAPPPKSPRTLWRDLIEGFRYVGRRPRLRLLLLCSSVVSMFGAPYLVLMPLFARDVMHWDEKGLSILMGTAGAGAFFGALMLAYMGDFRRKGRFMLGSSLAAAFCLVGFSLAAQHLYSLALLFGVGFSMVCFFAIANTLVQQLVRDEMRGRVMSMWILTFIGTMPIGSFLAGAAAERYSAPSTLMAGGVTIALFIVLILATSTSLREL